MIPWESCVLWLGYPLQNGVWPDVSKHDNDGIITGAFWEGDSLEFDGIDDHVNCGNDASLEITEAITIEALIYVKTSVETTPIVSKNYGDSKIPYYLLLYSFYPRFHSYDTGVLFSVNSPTALNANTWYHLVGTFDKTLVSENAKIYVNGIKDGAADYTGFLANNTQDVYVARYYSGYSEANISLVRIYNQCFTAQQVREAYEQSYRLI